MSTVRRSLPSGKHLIYIWSPNNPAGALEQLDKHLRHDLIDADQYVRAILRYEGDADENFSNPRNYALKCYSKYRREELWISGVASSSKCAAADAALQCLLMLGFDVNPYDEIYDLPIGEKHTFIKKFNKK